VESYGNTPLYYAAKGTPESIVALLEAGVDVNTRSEYGVTPLHFAASRGTPEPIVAGVENEWAPAVAKISGGPTLRAEPRLR
jgi:ankyrin repeat protein